MNLPTKEQKKTVAEYRDLKAFNQSKLKEFISNKRAFYRKYILGEVADEEKSFDMVYGSLVDVLLFSSQDFDKYFCIANCVPPVGQMLDLVQSLYRKTLVYSTNGELTRQFTDIFQEAFIEVSTGKTPKFKGKTWEKALEMFVGSDAEVYYEELRRNTGREVVTLGVIDSAEKTVAMLKNNFITRDLFSNREGVDVYQQEAIEFDFMGHQFKCLPDHFEVHHKLKEIRLYDLKCTWNVEDFSYNYLKNRYDIQGGIYYTGLENWKKLNNLSDYTVSPMAFVTCDSSGYTNPLIHRTSMKDLNAAFNGYIVRGKRYMGIKEAIEELTWSLDTGNWNISKRAFEQNGIIDIEVNYE